MRWAESAGAAAAVCAQLDAVRVDAAEEEPRVAQLFDSFLIGGTETQAVELCLALREKGMGIAVLRDEGPPRDRLQGKPIASFPLGGSLLRLQALRQVLALARWLRRNRIELLHAHDF